MGFRVPGFAAHPRTIQARVPGLRVQGFGVPAGRASAEGLRTQDSTSGIPTLGHWARTCEVHESMAHVKSSAYCSGLNHESMAWGVHLSITVIVNPSENI